MNFEMRQATVMDGIQTSTDVLVLLVSIETPLNTCLDQEPSHPLGRWLNQLHEAQSLPQTLGHWVSAHHLPDMAVPQVIVVRSNETLQGVQEALHAVFGVLKVSKPKHVTLHWLQPMDVNVQVLEAAYLVCHGATYTYTHTKPSAKTKQWHLEKLTFLTTQALPETLLKAATQWQAKAKGIQITQEWANRPANHATPSHLAQAALDLAQNGHGKVKVHVDVKGATFAEEQGMGALLSVTQGSDEPMRWIELTYKGSDDAPIVLIGKGITFDSGGISLKPGAGMDEMKFDMCGAATVLGVFTALADLHLPIHVVGLIPACENMPSGKATKPGDVVTSLSGQTIEILNTDAEGRLILCDALTYAQQHFAPRAMVDIATLTGACVIALGGVRAGLFSNHDELALALQQAGEAVGDLCWRMPLDDDYAKGLKSNFADMANVAGREAGSVTAAKFLQKFVKDTPWAHLDIAGVAWKSGSAKGATGRPVPLLLSYLERLAG